jgi:quercetin dioxygenase-like cupin family protein
MVFLMAKDFRRGTTTILHDHDLPGPEGWAHRWQAAPAVTRDPRPASVTTRHTPLGSSIARLAGSERRGRVVRLPRAGQAVVRDLAGWERRILSPSLPGVEFEFMRTTLGPGVDAGKFDPHPSGSREYVAVESGELELTIDGAAYGLGTGDAIYYEGDCDHGFRNRQPSPCVYYLVMDIGGRAGAGHG